MYKPVCRLRLALYGHPDAGGYWEMHCDKHMRDIGFEPIDSNDAWRSCYWHAGYKAFLIIYVDDFKLSAPTGIIGKIWRDIQDPSYDSKTKKPISEGVKLDGITGHDKYLGCKHIPNKQISPITGKLVNTMTYDMTDFMDSTVKR